MKISLVSEHGSPLAALGGVDAGAQNVHVAALATALADRGHSVTVFTRCDDDALPPVVFLRDGVTIVNIEAGPRAYVPRDALLPFMPALGRGIAAYWGQHPEALPDIVHSHFWTSGIAAREALDGSGLGRVPLVHTFHALGTVKRRHQGALDTSPPERARLEPSVALDAALLVATCNDEMREIEAMGVDAAKTVVIPSGVDLRLFRPDCTPEDTQGRRRIVTVGRLVARKGIDLTISALAHLTRQGYDDVDLHIVGGSSAGSIGDDPEALRLQEVADELGLRERVILRGQVPRSAMPAIIRSAALVTYTPWYEPFGIVPLEAMACGVPVVASKVGGVADSVVDGVTGLLVPPHAPNAIAKAAALLLDDPELASGLGANGVERVRTRYSWDTVAGATEDAYRRLLDRVSTPPSTPQEMDDRREYDRTERVRRRDRALSDEAVRVKLAARVEQARQRQMQMRETGEDDRVRSTRV